MFIYWKSILKISIVLFLSFYFVLFCFSEETNLNSQFLETAASGDLNNVQKLFKDPEFQVFVQLNRYQSILWFNKEMFKKILKYFFLIMVLDSIAATESPTIDVVKSINENCEIIYKWMELAEQSQYQVVKFLELLENSN